MTCGNGPDAGTRERTRHIAQKAEHGGLECIGSTREANSCIFCDGKEKAHPESLGENTLKENIQAQDGSKCINPCPSREPVEKDLAAILHCVHCLSFFFQLLAFCPNGLHGKGCAENVISQVRKRP